MHIYMMTRGIKHDSDRFINELSSQYLPFKANPDGTGMKEFNLQVSVRPIQFYEVVFPEEYKDVMLNSLFGAPGLEKDGSGKTQHKKHNKWIWAIRKILGVKPIPETWATDKKVVFYGDNVEKIAIGIKEDYWITKDDKHVSKKEEGSYEGL